MAKETQKAATKPVAIKIETGIAVPSRQKEIPDYGIPFATMKKGESVLLPFSDIPLEHARVLVQRFARQEEVEMITRTEKDDKGVAVGLRVWRG